MVKILKPHKGFVVGNKYEAVKFDNGWFVKSGSVSKFIPLDDAEVVV